MDHQLSFSKLALYDPGLPGINVEVTLELLDGSVTLNAKLDTGSTTCNFARRHGEILGLEIESGERIHVGTATGSFTAFRHEVVLTVLGFSFNVRVAFASDENFDRNVLGRLGFLDRVRLGLVDYEGKLYLSRYGDEEDSF